MLHFEKFSKRYGSTSVLEIGDLKIDGGIYWIRGLNGSGKSTLLKSIAGLLPFDGDVMLNQSLSCKSHPVEFRRKVNYGEAEPVFPEFLSGMDLVKVFVSAKNAPERQEQYYLERMRMLDYIHEPIGAYSSGMIKKLSIVLAFLGTPAVILLDEPLITIDSDSLKIVAEWIWERHRQEGTTFLMASHQVLDHHLLPGTMSLVVENRTLKKTDSHALAANASSV